MKTKVLRGEFTRFDTRLPKDQKSYFEKAAQLGGYRTLTDFIIATLQEKSRKIIIEKEQIIASEKDAEIFFNAITNPGKPNDALKNAAKEYKSLLPE